MFRPSDVGEYLSDWGIIHSETQDKVDQCVGKTLRDSRSSIYFTRILSTEKL